MLYIWMPEGSAAWRWRVAGEWQLAANLDALLQATHAENQKEVIVFFPTASAQVLQQPMSRHQLRQIGAGGVRYLLEEFSLSPVDQLNVQYHLDQQEQLNILAIPNGTISHYQNILALGSWRIQALLPDFLLVPWKKTPPATKEEPSLEAVEEASILRHSSSYLLRKDEYTAFVSDDLNTLLDYFPNISKLNFWGEIPAQDQAVLTQRDSVIDTVLHATLPASASLTDAQLMRHPFNVLPKSNAWQVSGYWKAIAAVLVAALLVQLLYDGVRVIRYNHVAKVTNAQAVQQFQTWFPEEKRIVNLKNQFQGHLKSAGDTDMNALSLLSRVGPILQQAQLPASQVQYRDNSLELKITAQGLPALETLRSQLADQGLKAELGSVNPANGQVSGLIRVQL
jgi:general secretion pathway protein L